MARAADRTSAAMLQAEPRSVLTKLMALFKKPNFPQKYIKELMFALCVKHLKPNLRFV